MKELSRKKKIKVLRLAIKYIKKRETCYMCVAIRLAYNATSRNHIEDFKYSLILIPELLNYKPDDVCKTGAWLGCHEYSKRIEILNSILSDLKKQRRLSLISRTRDKIINLIKKGIVYDK